MNKYLSYLKSKLWKKRRYAALERAKFKCEECGDTRWLQVHHLTYERLGREHPKDLQVLCQGCHWIADALRKNPNMKLPEDLPDDWDNIEPTQPTEITHRTPLQQSARKVVGYGKKK